MIASSARNPVLTESLINIQLLSVIIGLLVFVVTVWFNYRYLTFFAVPLYLAVIASLVAVLLFGTTTRGTRGWFDFGGVSFQPSSLASILLTICFASYFVWARERINRLPFLVGAILMLALPAALIVVEPDIGNTGILVGVWLLLLHLTPLKLNRLLALYGLAVVALPLLWFNLEPYQRGRLLSFMNPAADPLGSGYNLTQSVIAVGSGGLTGRGWGRGTQSHLQFLPEQHTDFIFATFAEEQGFVGAFVVLFLFGLLIWRCIGVIRQTNDYLGQLLAAGVMGWFAIHVVVNVGMNIGIAPITGIPLPLVSYGGTAMLTAWLGLGLIESTSMHA